MSDPASLTERVEALARSLEGLERRLARVEARLETAMESADWRGVVGEGAGRGVEGPPEGDRLLPETLSYVGRILLALGGAYVLRALTEGGTLPPALGVTLGFLYGTLWIGLAWRAAGRGRDGSAVAHGATAAAVGLPLVWETTVRFSLVPPGLGAALLLGYVTLLYGVAWRYGLRTLGWIAGAGAFGTALAAMLGAASLPPFVGVLICLGGLVQASERSLGWQPLAWAAAMAADMGVVVLTLIASFERSGVDPRAALVSQLLLPAVYLGLFGALSLGRQRPIDGLAVGQSFVAVLLGLGGAWLSLRHAPELSAVVGASVLVAGVSAYVVAFRVVDRARRRPFHYFGTLGTVLTLFGSALVLEDAELLWAVFVPLAAGAGWRLRRLSLVLHAAAYGTAAAVGSGLLAEGVRAFLSAPWERPPSAAILTLAAVAAALAFPPPEGPYQGRFRDASRLVLLAIAVWGSAALAVRGGAWALGSPSGGDLGPGALAAVRTAVLAAFAVLVAGASRVAPFRVAGRLVYPLLVLGGVKLALSDFLAGDPATMVLSFLAFGTALILAPRLRRG